MAAPATVTLNGSLDCLLHADSGNSATSVPSGVRALAVQQMCSHLGTTPALLSRGFQLLSHQLIPRSSLGEHE